MKTFTVATVQYNCSEPDQKLMTENTQKAQEY